MLQGKTYTLMLMRNPALWEEDGYGPATKATSVGAVEGYAPHQYVPLESS